MPRNARKCVARTSSATSRQMDTGVAPEERQDYCGDNDACFESILQRNPEKIEIPENHHLSCQKRWYDMKVRPSEMKLRRRAAHQWIPWSHTRSGNQVSCRSDRGILSTVHSKKKIHTLLWGPVAGQCPSHRYYSSFSQNSALLYEL